MLLILANVAKGAITHAVRKGVQVKLSQCYAMPRHEDVWGGGVDPRILTSAVVENNVACTDVTG
jgi:hypothetical protein